MEKNMSAVKGRIIALIMLLFIVVWTAEFTFSFTQGPNNRNVTVDTRVNITGSPPVIQGVLVQNPITLGAGSLTIITCNASLRDYNGGNDVHTVNATLFISPSTIGSAPDNNTRYVNSSCTQTVTSGIYSNYTCTFPLNYYAVNGTWNCTVFANDSINLRSNLSNLTNVSALFALNVTTLIDYGEMNTGDYSANKTANVSNLGNTPINLSVEGYGRNISDGLSFVCENGNLTADLQHFAINNTADYFTKQALSGSRQTVRGLTIPKAINGSGVLNTTWWELYIDPSQVAAGGCNGSIIFQAETV